MRPMRIDAIRDDEQWCTEERVRRNAVEPRSLLAPRMRRRSSKPEPADVYAWSTMTTRPTHEHCKRSHGRGAADVESTTSSRGRAPITAAVSYRCSSRRRPAAACGGGCAAGAPDPEPEQVTAMPAPKRATSEKPYVCADCGAEHDTMDACSKCGSVRVVLVSVIVEATAPTGEPSAFRTERGGDRATCPSRRRGSRRCSASPAEPTSSRTDSFGPRMVVYGAAWNSASRRPARA